MHTRRGKQEKKKRDARCGRDTFAIALDKGTARRYDANGYLHVEGCALTKESVDEYFGREIAGARELRLEGDEKYRVYRPGDELEKAAASARLIPVLDEHDGRFDAEHYDASNVVGAVGSDVEYRSPYLVGGLAIHDRKTIQDIESGYRTQLSCGYRYRPVAEAGEFNGQPYDIKMTDIRFNHVALVRVGRAGGDVRVADSGDQVRQGEDKEKRMAKAKDDADPDKNGDKGAGSGNAGEKNGQAINEEAREEIAAIEAEITRLRSRLGQLRGEADDGDNDGGAAGDGDDEDDFGCGTVGAMDSAAVARLLEKRLTRQKQEWLHRDAAIRDVSRLLGQGCESKLMALDSAEAVYRYGLKACRVTAPSDANLAGLKGMIAAFLSGRGAPAAAPAAMVLDAGSPAERRVAELIRDAGIALR